ncbi:MAG TPA: LptE family protein [Bacteroidales bacterium]|nr:LptE family protein [Bacteroidales bacterium]
MNKIKTTFLLIPVLIVAATGCKVSYSFSGASIDYTKLKTVSIQYFQNRASLVQPTLSQDITDALIDKCKSQTKLKLVNSDGDVSFEGYITDYKTVPFTATSSTSQTASNRFTISVKVKFVNIANSDYSYEQTFTRYKDYPSGQDFSSIEGEYSKEIIGELIDDIFNKAFANW